MIVTAEILLALLVPVVPILEERVENCLDCNYGFGSSGKDINGDDCECCTPARVALGEIARLREALK